MPAFKFIQNECTALIAFECHFLLSFEVLVVRKSILIIHLFNKLLKANFPPQDS
jgi:hypothetical protein